MCSTLDGLPPGSCGKILKNLMKCDKKCRKCEENASVVLQRKFSYCRDCLLQCVTRKFRSTVGKLKLKQMKDRILVIFSGSQSSVVLLHQLYKGLNENNHKKLKLQFEILFIDDSILWPDNFDSTPVWLLFSKIQKQYNFKWHIMKLSNIYKKLVLDDIEEFKLPDQLLPNEYDLRLKQLFNDVKSNTSKMDLLLQMKCRASYSCAELLNCNKIFTSECATDVAIRLLSDTVLGRSSEIASNTAICDTRNPNIHHIRPLRELTSKEIYFYSLFSELDLVTRPSPNFMFSQSLQWETLLFICNLQEEFPSTVYTVYNIGDKLQTFEITPTFFCSLCHMPISAMVKNEIAQESCESTEECNEISVNKLKLTMCRGCVHVVNDMNTLNNLPILE